MPVIVSALGKDSVMVFLVSEHFPFALAQTNDRPRIRFRAGLLPTS
jgi:hypothetical protein